MIPQPRNKRPLVSTYLLCLFAASTVLLAACASNPLGISDKDWAVLTPEQRLQAREKQWAYDQALEQRRAAELAQRQEQARARAAELDMLRQQAPYGARVQCVLGPAQGWFNQQWRDIEPVALDLVSGNEQTVTVRHTPAGARHYTARAYANFDGQQVSLCLRSPSAGTANRCVRFLGTFADYRRGIQQHVQSHEYVRGHMRCSLVP